MGSRRSIAIVGAGGFAREVRWLIEDINLAGGSYEFAGYVVSSRAKLGPTDDSDHVVGDVEDLEAGVLKPDSLALGIGNPAIRSSLGQALSVAIPDIAWPPLVHPSVHGDFASWDLGRGTLLCAGVVGTVNIDIADFAMVNLSCTLGHEARVGAGAVLNPLVSVSGGVSIGDRTLIGTGASILQYLSIGDDAVVGAGAVVVKDVEAGTTVVGMPARPVGER